MSAHPVSSCAARRPYSCQRSTQARAHAGPLMRGVRSPPSALLPSPGLLPQGLVLHSRPCWADLGLRDALLALLGQPGLPLQGCGDHPASAGHWSCLDPIGPGSCLSLPGSCQRCSHMHLPCCMRLSYAFMRLRCGTRACCLHACFEHTSWDTWTACSSRDPLWSPLDLVGPGPRSVPESAVLFSLSFSASQTPSSLDASFSAILPCEREQSQRPQPAHLRAHCTFPPPPQRA